MSKKISVIIPVYNVEAYVEETIRSVIKQDIGFRDNVEIIIIDDGSPDGSAAICQKYVEKYPENIRYIKQKNQGVSMARNNGLTYAKGKYVHFLDSDDMLSRNAYRKTIEFLESHESEIDFATMRLEFFDASLGDHPLNYKFAKGDRVVDIIAEPSALVFHSAATIFVRDKIKYAFDPTIKISEDVKFLAEQLTENSKYGVVASATYFYRKRSNGLSAITGSQKNPTFYTVTPHKVYEYLFELMHGDSGPSRYAQWAVMYDLQWRLRQKKQEVISEKEETVYRETIFSLIKSIDDDIILAQKQMNDTQKLYVLCKKYGGQDTIPITTLAALQKRAEHAAPAAIIEFITDVDDKVEIEGRIPDSSNLSNICLRCGDKMLELERKVVEMRRSHFLGDTIYDGFVFGVKVEKSDLVDGTELAFYNYNNRLQLMPKRQSRLPQARYGYIILNNKLWVNKKLAIDIHDHTHLRHGKYETLRTLRILSALRLRESAKLLRQILRSKAKATIAPRQYIKPFASPLLELVRNVRDIMWRVAYYMYRPKNKIWILSDRFLAAGDNAEALYRHIIENEKPAATVYFAISKKSKDFERLRGEFGQNIINNQSLLYRLRFLRASKVISSHADDFVINPFDWRVKNFYDLFKFDFVFLQHGVTRNDMSGWLNRYNKNIKLFVTVAEQEYQSIFDYDYYYKPEDVLLSGFPRYDLLEDNSKNKIILAPTWRHHLTFEVVDASGNRPYNPEFKKSEYFAFYESLMNDKSLLALMRERGLTGEFYLHPSLSVQLKDFQSNDVFEIKSFPYDYRKAFREGNLLITDYSSVFFDFMYLNKPILFSQFDREEIFKKHIFQQGYIDDIKNGFGPVTQTYDDTVHETKRIIENNFVMDDIYQQRINAFFKYRDKHNSQRVYEAIHKLEEY